MNSSSLNVSLTMLTSNTEMTTTQMYRHNHGTNNSWYKSSMDDTKKAFSAAILIPLSVFGIFANATTMIVIGSSPKLKSLFNYIIFSLCVSDFLSALLSNIYLYRRTWGLENWTIPTCFCQISWGGDNATSIATSLHILLFAVMRFISSASPHFFKRIKIIHIKVCLVCMWVVSVTCGFIPFTIWAMPSRIRFSLGLKGGQNWVICSIGRNWFKQFKAYTLVGYSVFFYVPLVLIFLTSIGVSMVICIGRSKRVKERIQGSVRLSVTKGESIRQRKENQAILQLALIVGSFMLGYIPDTAYHIYVSLRGPPNKNNIEFGWWFAMVAYMLLRVSECLNPIFYNLASTKMRKETKEFFKKWKAASVATPVTGPQMCILKTVSHPGRAQQRTEIRLV